MVSYIRALMVELGEACHEASLQKVTDDIMRDTEANQWSRRLGCLQKELACRCAAWPSAGLAWLLPHLWVWGTTGGSSLGHGRQ